MIRLAACLLLCTTPLLGAPCSSSTYQVRGAVRDAAGTPIDDASVFLLLDVVSEKKFHQHGMRAARFHTDGAGRYDASIACHNPDREQASPCAKNPRDLTIAATADGHRLKLKSFKLKNLNVAESYGVCFVQVPDLVLAAER